MKLEGSYPALITPFRHGQLDEPALRELIRFQISGGSAGLVPCGSTGEAATLAPTEYRQVIKITVEEVRRSGRKIPVIAGIGTNATWKAVELAEETERWGADALLVLAPYYNKPTQEGIFQHYGSISKSVRIPIIVYNIPGRTVVNILPSTVARIAKKFKNIIAVKEAAGSLDQVSEILTLCPKGFTVLSGDDSLTLPMMSVGARGVVSVIANILPGDTAKLCSSFLKGDFRTAERLHLKMFPLIKSLFIETNPIPVKAAASMMGFCSDEMRLPLTSITPASRKILRNALKQYDCLK